MNKPLIALSLALSLTACKLPVSQVTQTDLAKTEYTAEAAFSAAGQSYIAFEASLPPDVKVKAKTILLSILSCRVPSDSSTCTGYLAVARQALAASNADTLAQQVSAVTSAASQLHALIGH